MNAITFATKQLEEVFNLFNVCAGGLTEEQYNWKPGGTANTISKSHVHSVSSIDFFINTLIAGGAPQWPQFAPAHNLPGNPLQIWTHEGTIPMAAVMEYSEKAQKLVDAELAKLPARIKAWIHSRANDMVAPDPRHYH